MFSNLLVKAQQTGIKFEENLSWEQIKRKAKAENKYIFLDCYATWCGPCKEMDRTIYSDKKVGESINMRFVSVRVQMDSTGRDNDQIKAWYAVAKNFIKQFNIHVYPTFLFLSPEAKVVDKNIGYRNVNNFISTSENALDSSTQYYTLKDSYKRGELTRSKLTYLASKAKGVEDNQFADTVAKDYLSNYLIMLDKNKILTKENLYFINYFSNIIKSTDSIFNFILDNVSKIDKIVYGGFSTEIIDKIIEREEVYPFLYSNNYPITSIPPWRKMKLHIKRRFDKNTAERIILAAQFGWYYRKKDWEKTVSIFIKQCDKYGIDTVGASKYAVNNIIFDLIFIHSNKRKVIEKGISLMKMVIISDPWDGPNLDTYANLLYKAGKIEDAITFEEKAIKLAPTDVDIKEN